MQEGSRQMRVVGLSTVLGIGRLPVKLLLGITEALC